VLHAIVVAQQLTLDILEANMNWKTLSNETELQDLVSQSFNKPQLIFKHSTTCSISSIAKSRLDRATVEMIDCWYLDLLSYRSISNSIAEKFSVHHESPQVLLIKNGECVYDESHSSIYVEDILDNIN
jgi:bacillithiol system protein YtxJ